MHDNKIKMPVMVKFSGPRACFARPECPTERLTYQVPTPSAARGMLERCYWKPECVVKIREIRVLKPLSYFHETTNGLFHCTRVSDIRRGYYADFSSPNGSNRLQRHLVGLKDVEYVIVADYEPFPYHPDLVYKHWQIVTERIALGQCFERPSLGPREFTADFAPATGAEPTFPINLSLGRMLYDHRYNYQRGRGRFPGEAWQRGDGTCDSIWYAPELVNGVIKVPDMYDFVGGSRGPDRLPPPRPLSELVA